MLLKLDLSLKGQPCNDETTKTLYYFGYTAITISILTGWTMKGPYFILGLMELDLDLDIYPFKAMK